MDEEQQREKFHQQTVLTHSKNKSENCPAEHTIKVHDFSFSVQKGFRQQGVRDMSQEVLNIEIPRRPHHIDDMESINSTSYYQHDFDLFRTDCLAHPHWDLISCDVALC
jgi:hypothetical protein